MTTTTDHATHVEALPRVGKWQVHCDQCGRVGLPQEYENDAIAIAVRHAEVGGFER